MEELTPIQKNKLGDFREQYASIKHNIDDANDSLEALFAKRDLEASAFAIRQKRESLEIEKLNKKKESLVGFIQSETVRIESLSKELDKGKKEFEKYRSKEEMNIFAKHEQADEGILEAKEELRGLRRDIDEARKDKIKTDALSLISGQILAETEKKSRGFEITAKLHEKDLNRINAERESAVKVAEGEIKRQQENLKKIQESVAEEAAKMSVPLKSLRAQEEDLAIRKAAVEVQYHRALKMFQALKPGLSLDDIIAKEVNRK